MLPDLGDLEKLDQEAQDKAIEVGLSLLSMRRHIQRNCRTRRGSSNGKIHCATTSGCRCKGGWLVFSATFEISGFTCHDWTDQVEGALVVSIADYIRVNTKKISMKAQCDADGKSPRNYFGDVGYWLVCVPRRARVICR